MRYLILAFALLLAGCTQQPSETVCPEVIEQNITQPAPGCTSANITITSVVVNQTCNQSLNKTNLSAGYVAPVPDLEGIPFANGSYVLVLDDVSYPTSEKGSCGIFSVMDAGNKSVLNRFIICPKESQYWKSPEDDTYRIVVKNVAAGYTRDIKWADVVIYG
jgi:hypothetical protein